MKDPNALLNVPSETRQNANSVVDASCKDVIPTRPRKRKISEKCGAVSTKRVRGGPSKRTDPATADDRPLTYAENYVLRVKLALPRDRYVQFSELLQAFAKGEIDAIEASLRIHPLFKDHTDLHREFLVDFFVASNT